MRKFIAWTPLIGPVHDSDLLVGTNVAILHPDFEAYYLRLTCSLFSSMRKSPCGLAERNWKLL
jgi:hypothetical protein